MSIKPLCNKCGKCCYFPSGEGNGKLKACKYLQKKNDKYHCKVYYNRLNKVIGVYKNTEVKCTMYNSLSSEIVGCPLNLDNGKWKRDVIISEDNYKQAQGIIIND